MFDVEVAAKWADVWLAVATTTAIFVAIITYTRIVGLRSFSKMSAFDFAATVAIGSTMSAVGMANSSLAVGVAVLATLYGLQFMIALARRHAKGFEHLVDNRPVLLVAEGRILEDNMRATRITRADLLAKLREANVLELGQVRAVVLETTGDINVLHGEGDFDHHQICAGVLDADRLG